MAVSNESGLRAISSSLYYTAEKINALYYTTRLEAIKTIFLRVNTECTTIILNLEKCTTCS